MRLVDPNWIAPRVCWEVPRHIRAQLPNKRRRPELAGGAPGRAGRRGGRGAGAGGAPGRAGRRAGRGA
ncbi:MAG: hypothetical protein ACYDEN_07915, partial [Acidimicrobiales bacterium]